MLLTVKALEATDLSVSGECSAAGRENKRNVGNDEERKREN